MDKKWLYVLLLAVAGFGGFYLYRRYQVAPAVNFNGLSLVDMNNVPVTFGQLKGKRTVLCFSASWCGSCLTELKELNSVKEAELAGIDVVVISDESLERVRAMAQTMGYPFTFLKMNQPFSSIGINAIPVSYLLNARQDVKKKTVGYIDWKDASTREHLKKLMEE
jgi:peroxiredoxin